MMMHDVVLLAHFAGCCRPLPELSGLQDKSHLHTMWQAQLQLETAWHKWSSRSHIKSCFQVMLQRGPSVAVAKLLRKSGSKLFLCKHPVEVLCLCELCRP